MNTNSENNLPGDSLTMVRAVDALPEFHNYEKKLKVLMQDGIISIPDILMLNIAHDDWCDLYKKKRCNCNPTISDRLSGKTF